MKEKLEPYQMSWASTFRWNLRGVLIIFYVGHIGYRNVRIAKQS